MSRYRAVAVVRPKARRQAAQDQRWRPRVRPLRRVCGCPHRGQAGLVESAVRAIAAPLPASLAQSHHQWESLPALISGTKMAQALDGNGLARDAVAQAFQAVA